jgi:ABC-type sugar transport system substrate-binding protein
MFTSATPDKVALLPLFPQQTLMKKIKMLLAAFVLLAGASQTAFATSNTAATTVKQAYPDDPYFQAGLADGQARGRELGKGNPQVSVEYQQAYQNQVDATNAGDTDGANYWWGYRVGIGQYR